MRTSPTVDINKRPAVDLAGLRQDAMTTAQLHTKHPRPPRNPRRVRGALMVAASFALCSCAQREPHVPLATPYAVPSQILIAVAPLINESGTTIVDELHVADNIANTIQGIDGLGAIPVNRTIAAMRASGLSFVLEPDEAIALAKTLGADAIIVGTITAWNPYQPLQIGMSLALFPASDAMYGYTPVPLDPRALTAAATEYGLPDSWIVGRPVAILSEFFDGEDPGVMASVRIYAEHRDEPPHALRERRFTTSMKLFAKFVSHELVRKLLDIESARLTGIWARDEITERR